MAKIDLTAQSTTIYPMLNPFVTIRKEKANGNNKLQATIFKPFIERLIYHFYHLSHLYPRRG